MNELINKIYYKKLFLLQYYEMSYGLSVEVQKHVSLK